MVRDTLRPTVLSWLFPRRPYRGHPLAWAVLGGAVAAGLTALGVWLGDQPTDEADLPGIADVAPAAKPDTGVPAVHQLAVMPDPADEVIPPPRLAGDDRIASADPEPELPGRAVAADEEKSDQAVPRRLSDGKATLQPDAGPR